MYKCGIGKFRPSWLQEFCTITWFTVFASILTFLQGVYFGYLLGILTTIEKRFEIRSQYSGALLSCWDAGYCVTILIIGHFASRINKPRWIAMGVTLIALCNFGLALPNFVFGPLSPNNRAVHSDLNSVKSGLCGANESETTSNQLNMANTNDYAYWMIAFFQIVIGIASAPAVTLVFVYVDDNCSKKRSPFLISFVLSMWGFGPAAGFAFSSVCTNIYVTLETPVGMTSKDPNWIGAWWLGLLINGCLLLLFGAPLYLFPSHMKRSKDRELTNVNQLSQPKESEDLVKTNKKPEQITAETNSNWFKDIFDKLINILISCYQLIKNPIMLTLSISSILGAMLWSGFTAFSPKYLETQFHQPAHSANLISALGQTLANGISVIVGGKLLSHFSPTPKNMCLLVIISNCIALMTYIIGGFLGCENIPIEGWRQHNNFSAATCQTDSACVCTGKFNPVCAGNITYFTACDAGCSYYNSSSLKYENCACTDGSDVAGDGLCSHYCPTLVAYLIIIYTGSAFGALFSVASTNIMMWSVPKALKGQAVALSSLLSSLLGFMPSQIIFGRIVDTTCIYWSGGGGDGSTTEANGYCQLYDNTDLRYKLHFSVAAFLTASILAFCGTYVVSRTFNFHIDRGVRRDSIISAREVQMVLEDEGEEN